MLKKILLVDDDAIFNFLNTKLLERMGVASEVHAAMNGEQALKLLNGYFSGTESLPDVILLDLSMPVMDGFTFLEAFKRLSFPKKEDVSVIIVSSSGNPLDRARAKEMGVTHYLTKPLTEAQLGAALDGSE